jgi:hypothetical protein
MTKDYNCNIEKKIEKCSYQFSVVDWWVSAVSSGVPSVSFPSSLENKVGKTSVGSFVVT